VRNETETHIISDDFSMFSMLILIKCKVESTWCQLFLSRQYRYPQSKYREYMDARETKTTSTIWNVQGTVSDIPFRISMEELPPEW